MYLRIVALTQVWFMEVASHVSVFQTSFPTLPVHYPHLYMSNGLLAMLLYEY